MKPLLTIPEAAEVLGVPKASLRTAATRHGFLVSMGRNKYLESDSLGELVKKCRDPPKAPDFIGINTPRIGMFFRPGFLGGPREHPAWV